jgi:hypothetical protein
VGHPKRKKQIQKTKEEADPSAFGPQDDVVGGWAIYSDDVDLENLCTKIEIGDLERIGETARRCISSMKAASSRFFLLF